MQIVIDKEKTQKENADLNGCSRYIIRKYCEKHSIKLKSGRGKPPSVLKNPFLIDDVDGSYWLGYFLGDGIVQNKNMGITSKDLSIITKFHTYCNNTNKIHSSSYLVGEETRYIYKSLFGNEDVLKYLQNLGIRVSSKKIDSKPKIQMNWNIVRGLFDADGSLSGNEFKITSSNKYLLKLLIAFFVKEGFEYRINKKGTDMSSYDLVIKRKYFETGSLTYSKLYSKLYNKSKYYLVRKKLQFATLLGD